MNNLDRFMAAWAALLASFAAIQYLRARKRKTRVTRSGHSPRAGVFPLSTSEAPTEGAVV